MLTRESGEVRPRAAAARVRSPRISAKMAKWHCPVRAGGNMGQARDPRLSVADEGNRAPDAAQRPQREREAEHRRNTRVLSEAKRQIVVAAWLK